MIEVSLNDLKAVNLSSNRYSPSQINNPIVVIKDNQIIQTHVKDLIK